MNTMRTLLVAVMGAMLFLPINSFAATKKVIIGFNRTPANHEHNLVYGARGRIHRTHRHIRAISAELPEEEIARLKQDSSVAYVVDNIKFTLIRPVEPLSAPSPEYVDSWGVLRIGSNVAASRGYKGAGIKVAIVDSGIDYNHPDLKDNYRGGYDFVNNTTDPIDDDFQSHGTHVAGIIAARDNGTGVVGVAPEASLYAVKVFSATAGGDMDTVVAGIEWAIDNKMDVINLSIGYSGDIYSVYPDIFKPLKDVCDRAYQAGIVLVAAAGNDNREIVSVPAAFDSVIAVAATDQNDQRAVFTTVAASSYGAKVELAAPGTFVKSTVSGGGYAFLSGTSQASPHVAGAAAVILSSGIADANGNGSRADEVRARLDTTAKDLGDPGRDKYFGWGLVDLSAATDQATRIHIEKKKGMPKFSTQSVSLGKGSYSFQVRNNGLERLAVKTAVGSDKEFERVFATGFTSPVEELNIGVALDNPQTTLVFTPYGDIGSSADITITKLAQ
ncbi:S8 family peptidase [Geobacter hydrogenophilus]|uniref:Peptidase S8 n=1 Tax=Geobacter hydrogenophilus TaxID=40983 RepID=A0A9W6FYH0_9BACT|nr:S8 family peptidase [Geobacter hydrogenophilus]MBT0895732.1 S8 family peptidase [Geobacter hydrogenophilus]GLI37103.1 peptidase S8 [Geobacter hydrogenophilus]